MKQARSMRSVTGRGADAERSMPFEDQKATVEQLPTPSMLLRTALIGTQHRRIKARQAPGLDPPLPDWRREKQLSPIPRMRSLGRGRLASPMGSRHTVYASSTSQSGSLAASSLKKVSLLPSSPPQCPSVGGSSLSRLGIDRTGSAPAGPLELKALHRLSSHFYGEVEEDPGWEEPERPADEDDKELVVGGEKGPAARIGLRVEISPKAARNRMQRYGETYKNFGGEGTVSIVYPGYVWVKWDSGQGHWYNIGQNEEYELLKTVPKKIKTEQDRWLEAQQVRVWRPEDVRTKAKGPIAVRVYGSDEFGSRSMTHKPCNSLEEWWDLLQRERAKSSVPGFDVQRILPSP